MNPVGKQKLVMDRLLAGDIIQVELVETWPAIPFLRELSHDGKLHLTAADIVYLGQEEQRMRREAHAERCRLRKARQLHSEHFDRMADGATCLASILRSVFRHHGTYVFHLRKKLLETCTE